MRLNKLARSSTGRAFTLIEVLVVMGILATLLGILVPALGHSRQIAKRTMCQAGLQQLGVAISTYAMDSRGYLPFGPDAPPPSARNFYPQTGNITSLLSLRSGKPVGLGLLMENYLGDKKEVLFCPGADDVFDTQAAIANVGVTQVEGSYYYRHAGVTSMSGNKTPPRMQLDRLGNNSKGVPIRALAMDTQFKSPPKMAQFFGVSTKTHHRKKAINALYTDGHVSGYDNSGHAPGYPNTPGRFTVDIADHTYNVLKHVLTLFEMLDSDNLD